MYGYHGQYLRIELPAGRAEVEPLPEGVLRRFVGGVGLAAYLLHRECPASVGPLAPEAPLVFAFSPLVGTPLTTSAKFAVAAKSPLTERFNDALSSSHFAIHGKQTGFDAIVIVGHCEEPTVLLIDDSAVRLEPAADVWGRTLPETTEQLTEHYAGFTFGAVGPAGEKLVRFATISFDGRHAGRGGLGAVMGSKLLKAVGARGTQRTPVADPAGVVAAARDLSKRSFGPATAKYRELGTVANLLAFNRLNALPTRNFRQGQFEEAAAISGEALNAAHRVARKSCAACTIGCEHIYEIGARGKGQGAIEENLPSPPVATGGRAVRLEYESLFALGPLCGVSDRDAILRAARLCDDLGLDTISAGATVAFAMECSERNLIPHHLPFGDGDGLLTLLSRIAHRDGLGDLLADGTRRTARVIGGAAPDFAPHVKGLELPGYEPRAMQAMALGFAVGTRGADHNRSGAYEADFSPHADRRHGNAESARLAVETEDRAALIDSLILCKFLRGVFADVWGEAADLLGKVTGWDVTADELRTVARRVVTARKLFNAREGWTPAEDTLPRRFLTEGLPDGTAPGAVLPGERLREMVRAYNESRGWSTDGWVPAEQVAELGLGDL
ncbi:MAG TPA: aldehyde ferredoxin oxidoreductase family protein [Fimbriiglobus sp.]|nr:aldehyde ferredoxin oxidoreductase family protein [Fimbriiglobus sp.]